jgi:hypothetical protein
VPPPVSRGRHRRPPATAAELLAAAGTRLAATVLLVTALAVGSFVAARSPETDTDSRERPFVRTGSVGQPVSARTFDATVLGVRGAATLVQRGTKHDTSGVWVIVRIRLVAREKPISVGYAAVRDSAGRTFRASGRIDQPMGDGSRTLQPGIPIEGEVAFEVPRPSATALTVVLATEVLDRRMDAVVEVALPGVDGVTVERWVHQPEPVTPAGPEVSG